MKMKTYYLLLTFLYFPLSFSHAQDPWKVTGEPKPNESYYGLTVANGVLGLVSSRTPLQMSEVVLNGTFDTYGRGRVSNIQKVFSFANFQLRLNGKTVNQRNVEGFTQSLNMQTGILTTQFTVPNIAKVSYIVTSLRHLPYTAYAKVEVTPISPTVNIELNHEIKSPEVLREVRQYFSSVPSPHGAIHLMSSEAESPTGKHKLAVSCSYLAGEKGHLPTPLHRDEDYGRHFSTFQAEVSTGETFSLGMVGSVCSSAQYADPFNEAERLALYAALEGEERLMKRHKEAWKKLWEGDIQIEGDAQAQQDVRFALYHLYAFNRAGSRLSPSPMGLSGLGYNGHAFWDTELWMYPPILLLNQGMAKSMMDYRLDRLEVAKQNAFSHGYQGAMYPWESDEEGQEATPVWALTGPFEHHISGDVAWALWQYYLVTQDQDWLAEAYPAIKAIAAFWVSRVEMGNDGQYHINNVVGADEYAENIDDDAFTNGVAITSLRIATEAAQLLGYNPEPSWAVVADKTAILKFADGTVREHSSYEGETIKQADVNLLSYPLGIITDKETQEKNLNYYTPKMDAKGPAMAQAVLSIMHSKHGSPEKAYELWKQSYQPNKVPPFGVLAETAGGTNPYFATGAGGMLQTLIYGFAGLKATEEGIVQEERKLPKKWKAIRITGVGVERETFEVK